VRDKPTKEAPVKHVLGLTCKASTGTGHCVRLCVIRLLIREHISAS
jgi:hypothetical protein